MSEHNYGVDQVDKQTCRPGNSGPGKQEVIPAFLPAEV